jgi:hypothetical protein
MARFQAAEPNGLAVQPLEVLVRTAVFESANQLVGYLLQQAADRIDAAYQPKPGWQRKGRVPLTRDCIFGFFTLERDYYYRPSKQQGHYPAAAPFAGLFPNGGAAEAPLRRGGSALGSRLVAGGPSGSNLSMDRITSILTNSGL